MIKGMRTILAAAAFMVLAMAAPVFSQTGQSADQVRIQGQAQGQGMAAPKATGRAGAQSEVDQWIDENLSELKQPETPTMQAPEPPPPGGYRTVSPGGLVDWGNGHMAFTVERSVPADSFNPARDRAMAVRRATLQARKNLAEAVSALAIDGSRTVATALSDAAMTQVRMLLQNSRVQQEEFVGDDGGLRLAVTAVAELRDDLAESLMPPAEPFLAGVPESVELTVSQIPAPQRDPEQSSYLASMADLGGFTGIIVDARGLGANPALLPLVVDPAGLTAYGPFQVSREDAAQHGAALYVGDPANSLVRSRTGASPLKVRALAVSGPAAADLVVSYEDARLIRTLFKNEDARNHCRAVIILD